MQNEAAALRLEQPKAHAGNVEEGVLGMIETACERILGRFARRSRSEDEVVGLW
jgi:hypothetical protein